MQTERPNRTRLTWRRVMIAATLITTVVLLFVVALSAGRASTRDDEQAVRAVIQQQTDALAGADPNAFCQTLTREARVLVEIVFFDDCQTATGSLIADNRDLLDDPVRIKRVKVRGDLATAIVQYQGPIGTEPITLRKQHGRWLVDVEPNEPK